MAHLQKYPVERRSFQIDDVDIPNRLCHVKDQTGGRIMVSFRNTGASFQIPSPGEVWICERNTGHDWHLFRRRDKNAEHLDLQDMAAGDTRTQTGAGGTHRIRAAHTEINGGQYGYPVCDVFSSLGADPGSCTLTQTPVNDASIKVFWKGGLMTPGFNWSRDGLVLTLTGFVGTDTVVVYYQTTDSG
jgi:hypothetical protein